MKFTTWLEKQRKRKDLVGRFATAYVGSDIDEFNPDDPAVRLVRQEWSGEVVPGDPICSCCPFGKQYQPVPSEGEGERVVLGTAPGREEAMQLRPAVGPGGKLLRPLVPKVRFVNALSCFPGDKPPADTLRQALACCAPRVRKETEGCDVMALGNEAVGTMLGKKVAITSVRGQKLEGARWPVKSLTATVHPSYVLRAGGPGSDAFRLFKQDLEAWGGGREVLKAEVEIWRGTAPVLPESRERLPKLPPRGTPIVIDLETTGLDPEVVSPEYTKRWGPGHAPGIRCFALCWDGKTAHVSTVGRYHPTVQALLSGDWPLIAQNHAFEEKWIRAHWGDTSKITWLDTMLLAHDVQPDRGKGRYSLDPISEDFVPAVMPSKKHLLEEAAKAYPDLGCEAGMAVFGPLEHGVAEYNGWDALKTWHVWNELTKLRGERPKDRLAQTAIPAARFLAAVQDRGMAWSGVRWAEQVHRLEEDLAALEKKLRRVARIKWSSGSQVEHLVRTGYAAEWVEVRERKVGKLGEVRKERVVHAERRCFDPLTLPAHDDPELWTDTTRELRPDARRHKLTPLALSGLMALNPRAKWLGVLRDYKKAAKTLSIFTGEKGPKDRVAPREPKGRKEKEAFAQGFFSGSVHPLGARALVGTATARLSEGIHNWHKPLKSCVVPRPGHVFLAADFDGAEVTGMAFLSQDPTLCRIVREGLSLHDMLMERTGLTERRAAKAVNFAIGYGGGEPAVWKKLAEEFWGRYSHAEVKSFVANRRMLTPTYFRWAERQQAFAVEHGYIECVTGFRRPLPGARSRDPEALRQAVNTPVQHLISDCMLTRAMEIEAAGIPVVLLKHDEVMVEVPKGEWRAARKTMKQILENPTYWWGTMDPGLTATFSLSRTSWGELEEVK